MSGAIDVLNSEHPKRVLIVAPNSAVSGQTGWPIGFWWAELTHPYWEFTEHGYQVDIASPDGGALQADSWSDPRDDSRYAEDDLLSLGFIASPKHAALVEKSLALAEVDPTRLADGRLLVDGKTWTGFANSEEDYAETSPWGCDRRLVCSRCCVGGRRSGLWSVIDGLLASARAGCSGVLVIRGEPGIGKTALLDYAACRAGVEGVRVLRGAGVESETELPFAGLHLLFGSALERCSALPPPQRDALDAAFGLRHAGPDDGLLVGLAVLSLLAGLAGDGRLVCLVDDAHWLDRPSARALVFAARRLHREGIAVVVAAGDHHRPFPAPGLPELRLGGLDAAAAAALLGEHGAGLPAQVRDRVLAQARGNPLGLIELPAAYRDGLVPAAGAGPAAGLGLTDRLRQAFGGQVRRLPEPTQTLLLVAAAQGSGELAVVLAAAATLGVAAADLGPAERAGLVVVADGTVRFRHPLVAAAVYQGAVLSRRQGVHRALADAWRGLADADRRAWHLAAAAPGPDEQAAAALEGAAAKAIAAGGYAAAAAAAQRAVQLTADPAAHARRLTLAAQAAAETGELDGARRLAERAAAHTTDPVLQARLAGVRAVADFAQGRLNTAHRLRAAPARRAGRPGPARPRRRPRGPGGHRHGLPGHRPQRRRVRPARRPGRRRPRARQDRLAARAAGLPGAGAGGRRAPPRRARQRHPRAPGRPRQRPHPVGQPGHRGHGLPGGGRRRPAALPPAGGRRPCHPRRPFPLGGHTVGTVGAGAAGAWPRPRRRRAGPAGDDRAGTGPRPPVGAARHPRPGRGRGPGRPAAAGRRAAGPVRHLGPPCRHARHLRAGPALPRAGRAERARRAALSRRAQAAPGVLRTGPHPATVRRVAAPPPPQGRRPHPAARRGGRPGPHRRRAVGHPRPRRARCAPGGGAPRSGHPGRPSGRTRSGCRPGHR